MSWIVTDKPFMDTIKKQSKFTAIFSYKTHVLVNSQKNVGEQIKFPV